MHEAADVSIVIVTWNSEDEIGECIGSVIENTSGISYEIIVVDNNSSDKTTEIVKSFDAKIPGKLRIISNSGNTGFTKGCNTGITASAGKNILLLNPDTKISGNALKVLIDKIGLDEKAGAIAPQLLNKDGSIQSSCRTFPTYFDMFCELSLLSAVFPKSKVFSKWKMNYFDHDREEIVDQPMAAALLVRKNLMTDVNNFDERYSMFFNDVDLCKKIYGKGYDILFYPMAKIFHSKGVSIYKDRARMINIWNNDCLSYFKKYNYNLFLYSWLSVSLKLSGYFRIFLYKLKNEGSSRPVNMCNWRS
ncbi:MAG: glycosyltransferase family 2 protein [Ignavibacteria bacterium]